MPLKAKNHKRSRQLSQSVSAMTNLPEIVSDIVCRTENNSESRLTRTRLTTGASSWYAASTSLNPKKVVSHSNPRRARYGLIIALAGSEFLANADRMDLISESVFTLGRGGNKRPTQTVFEAQWKRFSDGINRTLESTWKPCLDSFTIGVLDGNKSSGTQQSNDPIPTNVLLLKHGAGDFHRRTAYAHALKSLDRAPHCPRLVMLEADVHRTQALVHKALVGDEDAKQTGKLGKVVVCFLDVEKFQPDLLRDLIYLLFVLRCAPHGRPGTVSDIGNIDCRGLVLCTYGTQDVLFERLGTRESTMVDVRAHHLPHTSTCINMIIAEVVIPRRAGPELTAGIYFQLMDDLEARDATLGGFVRGLRMAFLSHYTDDLKNLKQFLSQLPKSKTTFQQWKKQLLAVLAHVPMSQLMELNSVGASDKSVEKSSSSTSEALFIAKVVEWARELLEHRLSKNVLERCFALASTDNPGQLDLVERAHQRVYEDALSSSFSTNSSAESRCRRVRTRDHEFLSLMLSHWKRELKGVKSRYRVFEFKSVENVLLMVEEAAKVLNGEQEALLKAKTRLETDDRSGPKTKIPKTAVHGGISARSRRMEKLNRFIKDQQREEQTLVKDELKYGRLMVCDILESMAHLLSPIEKLPLHELVALTCVSSVRRYLGVDSLQPRQLSVDALRNPSEYGVEDSEMSVAYDVLSTSGKILGLQDWLSAFSIELERSGHTEAEINGRFVRTCSDMEYIGLLKQGGRRQDQIVRAVFEHR
ncbi:hypothetical protein NDN08_003498 [Rhodosorus marinus]|uniref:Origin recognition complex subunit 3 winged helix C-terminal domain-containing protein n=1 Tax=Rhodosorus marinus TaxID=101924 RepID=A0AAV8UXF0_9RHOD|nr:hypothetical protein NDN08_003498 [Rhodosorus marinus]